jgi:hypothetical protein
MSELPSEYYECTSVSYQPDLEPVQIQGFYCIRGANGYLARQFQFVLTTQADLLAATATESPWGDADVKAVVEAQLGIPCFFNIPAPPNPNPT